MLINIKKLIIAVPLLAFNLQATTYSTETINKDSFVTEVFGGIEQANILRDFRDNILLKSKEGKAYINTFYKILSASADVMLKDKYVRNETNKKLYVIIQYAQQTLESNQIPIEMANNINSLINLYLSSSFTNNKLIEEIEKIKNEQPILEYVKKFNLKKLTFNSSSYEKYSKDSILVKFKSNTHKQNISSILNSYNLEIKEIFQEIGVYNIKVPKEYGNNVNNIITSLNNNENIEYAEPNGIISALNTPNDPSFHRLWGLNNEGQNGGTYNADIDAPEAWNITRGKKSVIVAVIDTGVNYRHRDLKTNMWINTKEIPNNHKDDDHNGYIDDYRGWDFVNNDNDPIDDQGHGTHCSGTIGATGNNKVGVTGVNWNVRIMPLKFLDSCGSGKNSDAIKAILYAANMGVKITSNSWGGGKYSKSLYDAINYLRKKGGLFIAASGNGEKKGDQNDNTIMGNVGIDTDKKPLYPSSYNLPNIISVAATDRNDELASFSNYGKHSVDLAAPGVDIYSTTKDTYGTKSGTSMATPHVAGVAALIKSLNNNFTYTEIKKRILNNVNKLSSLEGKVSSGGRLNAYSAVKNIPPVDYAFLIPILHIILF